LPRHPVRLFAVAVLAAACGYVLLTVPRAPARVPDAAGWEQAGARFVKGVLHIHSDRSDGTGTPEEIAVAAARAGLAFVVLTDHGDGTRNLDRPVYRSGVLCIDGVEISTTAGHYLATGLSRTPYPLGGEPRDVVDDVRRLGGFGIAAHPDSPKAELRWTETDLPVDAIEWINADSQWRDESWPRLLLALTHYPFRPAPAVVSLFDAPEETFRRWDAMAATRRVLAVPGADAHARLAFTGETEATTDEEKRRMIVRLPDYEDVFRAFTARVGVDVPLSGRADDDAAQVLDGLRRGRVYSVIDALATPGWFEFTGTQASQVASMGDTLGTGAPIAWHARAASPEGAEIVLLRNGEVVTRATAPELRHESPPEPGGWRVEVHTPGAPGQPPIPFIVGNPIFVRRSAEPTAAVPPRRPLEVLPLYTDGDASGWRVEHQPDSKAALDALQAVPGRELALRFALNSNRAVFPFAATAVSIAGKAAGYDRLVFRARADRPMRISVQVRSATAPEYPRWRRSVPLDVDMRDIEIPFETFTPVSPETRVTPDLPSLDTLLFVIDTVNTAPATAGIVWLDEVRLARVPAGR